MAACAACNLFTFLAEECVRMNSNDSFLEEAMRRTSLSSSTSTPTNRLKAGAAGVGFITKPVDVGQLEPILTRG
jgi:hypothetical protein